MKNKNKNKTINTVAGNYILGIGTGIIILTGVTRLMDPSISQSTINISNLGFAVALLTKAGLKITDVNNELSSSYIDIKEREIDLNEELSSFSIDSKGKEKIK